MTLRFWTLAEGVATWPRRLAAPKELERVGEAWMLLVTCALRKEAWVIC